MDRCHLCKALPIVLIDTINVSPLINQLKIKSSFCAIVIFYTFYLNFLLEVGLFSLPRQKRQKFSEFFKIVGLIDGLIH